MMKSAKIMSKDLAADSGGSTHSVDSGALPIDNAAKTNGNTGSGRVKVMPMDVANRTSGC